METVILILLIMGEIIFLFWALKTGNVKKREKYKRKIYLEGSLYCDFSTNAYCRCLGRAFEIWCYTDSLAFSDLYGFAYRAQAQR